MKALIIGLLVSTSACTSTQITKEKAISLADVESVKLADTAENVQQKLGKPSEIFRHDKIPGKVGWIYEEANPPRISTTIYFSEAGFVLAKIYDVPTASNYNVQDIEKRYKIQLKPEPPVNCLAHSLKVHPTGFTTNSGEVSVGIDEKKNVVSIMWASPQWRSVASEKQCPNGYYP